VDVHARDGSLGLAMGRKGREGKGREWNGWDLDEGMADGGWYVVRRLRMRWVGLGRWRRGRERRIGGIGEVREIGKVT